MELTKEDIRNLIVMTNLAQISGKEATTVAVLQQKLSAMLNKNEDIQTPTKAD